MILFSTTFAGVFPYVGMATMFVFCDYNWPRALLHKIRLLPQPESKPPPLDVVSCTKKWTVTALIILYAVFQLFMPFSHFITKVLFIISTLRLNI